MPLFVLVEVLTGDKIIPRGFGAHIHTVDRNTKLLIEYQFMDAFPSWDKMGRGIDMGSRVCNAAIRHDPGDILRIICDHSLLKTTLSRPSRYFLMQEVREIHDLKVFKPINPLFK